MQTNGAKWRCVVRRREYENTNPQAIAARRARRRRFYHSKLKHDPVYLLDQQLRGMTRVRISY